MSIINQLKLNFFQQQTGLQTRRRIRRERQYREAERLAEVRRMNSRADALVRCRWESSKGELGSGAHSTGIEASRKMEVVSALASR